MGRKTARGAQIFEYLENGDFYWIHSTFLLPAEKYREIVYLPVKIGSGFCRKMVIFGTSWETNGWDGQSKSQLGSTKGTVTLARLSIDLVGRHSVGGHFTPHRPSANRLLRREIGGVAVLKALFSSRGSCF